MRRFFPVCSVLVRVPDFHPYFYIPAPEQPGSTHPDALLQLQTLLNRFAQVDTRTSWPSAVGSRVII